MDYFIMKTDSRINRVPQLEIPKGILHIGDVEDKINENISVIYVKGSQELKTEYLDYIESPIPLIAEKLYKILRKYQENAVFHQITLIEKDKGTQKIYYMMLPPVFECANINRTIYDNAGNVQDFVLDVGRIGKNRIFRVKELKKQIVVRLDVAESILRRETNGIWFEPIKQ